MTDMETLNLGNGLEVSELDVLRATKTVDRHAKDDAEFHVVMAMLGLADFEGAVPRPA